MDSFGEAKHRFFPFTAIVGLEKAKLALLCTAVNPTIGGVLLRGDKGTGKSTLVRALAGVLPDIEVVADCPFNCNPHNPMEMCDSCYQRWKRGEQLPIARRRMRVVDLPLSITVDRLVGTLDLKRALEEGIRALHPGLLAEANRNILYIDEVNLLDDYVADVLLDSAAMGWNIVEREGVSVKHPTRFILVGSMTPEEGGLRPHILDRFGLVVDVEAPMDPRLRCEIVKRVEEFHANPEEFYRKYVDKERQLCESVIKARELLPKVSISDDLLKLLADTVVKLGIRTNRAEIATVKTAKAIAALDGRLKVTLEDLERAMELSLPHRLKAKPFEQPPSLKVDLTQSGKEAEQYTQEDNPARQHRKEANVMGVGGSQSSTDLKEGSREHIPMGRVDDLQFMHLRQRGCKAGFHLRGSRDTYVTVVGSPQGHPYSYIPPLREELISDVDITATLTLAALRNSKPPIKVEKEDLRIRLRKSRTPTLTAILLDSSGSMALKKRIALAKGIAFKLLENSYTRRCYISLITFHGRSAHVLVPLTRNYLEVLKALENLPAGGKTPLSSALYALLLLTKATRMKMPDLRVEAILITDGRANVSLGRGESIPEELRRLSMLLRKQGVSMTIFDTSTSEVFDPFPSYIDLLEEAAGAQVFRV